MDVKYLIRLLFVLLLQFHGIVYAGSNPGKDFVKIPANTEFTFVRGLQQAPGAPGEKSPIMRSYYMAKYPVTNAEYAAFCRTTKHVTPRYWVNGQVPAGKEKHPVLWVSVDDAEAYCRYMEQENPGWHFRLPTEAEWENAARGPEKRAFPWGHDDGISMKDGKLISPFNFNGVVAGYFLRKSPDLIVTLCHPKSPRYGEKVSLKQLISITENGQVRGWINHADHTGFVYCDLFKTLSDEGGYTTPVDAYPQGKSAYGCMDMAGNSWDWTSSVIIATNGAERGQSVHAIRGGSWYATKNSCRADFRGEGRNPRGCYNTVGFRLVAEKAATASSKNKHHEKIEGMICVV